MASSHGRVVRINATAGYVILECTVLPIAGEEITLYRDNRAVGRVRVGAFGANNLIGADILQGTLMAGDWFMTDTPRWGK